MWLVAYFYHKTTRAPLVWWRPTVLLVNARANSVCVNNQVMTEITAMPWAYYHPYEIDSEIDYIGLYDPQNTDYLPSVDKLFIPATRWGGWGGSINISGIQATIRNSGEKVIKELSDKIKESEEYICKDMEEKKLDIQPIIDKIESIEIPEFKMEEKEAKKAQKTLEKLDKKISSYIDKEMSEKDELSAITREFTRLEMEDAKKEKEKEIEHKKMMEEKMKMEEEEDKKMLEMIKSEFEKQEEDEKEEKRKELEKEIEEKKKELNSL